MSEGTPIPNPITNVKLELVRGPEGTALYMNDTRIAGPKPWGGGDIVRTWKVTRQEIESALDA